MNIDERLEALAQSVELLTMDVHELRSPSQDMIFAITRLANTAHAHNGQLADHEDRIDKLEER